MILELTHKIYTVVSDLTDPVDPLSTSIPIAKTHKFRSKIVGCVIDNDMIIDADPHVPEIVLPYVSLLTNVPWRHFQHNVNRVLKKSYYDLFRDEYKPELHDTLFDLLSECPAMLHPNPAILFALITLNNKIKTDIAFGLPVYVYAALTK